MSENDLLSRIDVKNVTSSKHRFYKCERAQKPTGVTGLSLATNESKIISQNTFLLQTTSTKSVLLRRIRLNFPYTALVEPRKKTEAIKCYFYETEEPKR